MHKTKYNTEHARSKKVQRSDQKPLEKGVIKSQNRKPKPINGLMK